MPPSRLRSPRHPLSARLFFAGVLLLFADAARVGLDESGTAFPGIVRMLLAVTGPGLMVLSALVALAEGQYLRLKLGYQTWLAVLAYWVGLLLLLGLLLGNEPRFIVLDLLLFPLVFAGILVGCRPENWRTFDRIILAIFTANLVVCVAGLPAMVAALTSGLRTTVIDVTLHWGWINPKPYVFWSGLDLWPYLVLTARGRPLRHRVVIYGGVLLYFAIALLYEKRRPLFTAGLFVVLLSLSRSTGLKLRVQLAAAVLIVGLAVGSMVARSSVEPLEGLERQTVNLVSRFTAGGQGVWEAIKREDRINYDPVLVLTQFSGAELIAGRGLGATVADIRNYYPEPRTSTLHNGTALLLMKGGLALVLLWSLGWLVLSVGFFVAKRPQFNPYWIPILLVFPMSWATGFLQRSVAFALLMMCAGYLMARRPQRPRWTLARSV